MRFVDAVALDQSSVRITKGGGYLVADARVARVGIQTYGAHELGLKDRPATDVIRVYRSPDEVFAKDALGSMAHQPMTNDHPADMVDSTNWKELSIGFIGDGAAREVAQDGEYVRVSLAMMDKSAIDAWKNGKRELSVGYTCDVDFTPGTTASGEAYDAVQRNIRTNHLALVKYGRAGAACRIGDSWDRRDDAPAPMKDETMKTIMIDNIPVADVSPAAEAVIVKLQGQVADAQTSVGKLTADLATAHTTIQAKDGEIAGLNAKLKDAEVTPARLQQLADARAKVITDAKAIAGDTLVVDGKTDAEIKRAAVTAKLGDAAKDMADAAIDGAFLALLPVGDTQQRNPLADHIRNGGGATVLNDAQAAWQKAKDERTKHLNTNYQATSAA